MIIRKWEEKDNIRICELEKECFSDPWSYNMIADTFSSPNFLGYVIEENEVVQGYIGSTFLFEDAEILLVAVSKEFRKRGFGELLVRTDLDHLKEKGVEKVFLEVRKSNIPAFSCYQKCGFVPIGIRKGYYGNGEDAIVMERKL